jgi:hypothetical protein
MKLHKKIRFVIHKTDSIIYPNQQTVIMLFSDID